MVRRTRLLVLIVLLVLLALGAARAVVVRIAERAHGEQRGRAREAIRADHPAAHAHNGPDAGPARALQGYVQSPISARASGYLQALDQGHRQPRREGRPAGRDRDAGNRPAAVAEPSPRASQGGLWPELAQHARPRWETLRHKDVVSQQDLDERRRSARAGREPRGGRPGQRTAAARAGQGFKRMVAPFPGIITRRNVDAGDLIDRRRRRRAQAARCSCWREPIRCASAASTCRRVCPAVVKGQAAGGGDAGRAARPEVQRPRSRAPPRHRHLDAHDAGRSLAAQPRRRAAAGRLRPRSSCRRPPSGASPCPPMRCCSAAEGTSAVAGHAQGRIGLRPVTLSPQLRRERRRGGRRTRGPRPHGAQPSGLAGRWRRGRPGGARCASGRCAPEHPGAAHRLQHGGGAEGTRVSMRASPLRARSRSPPDAWPRAAQSVPTLQGAETPLPVSWKLEAPWRLKHAPTTCSTRAVVGFSRPCPRTKADAAVKISE